MNEEIVHPHIQLELWLGQTNGVTLSYSLVLTK